MQAWISSGVGLRFRRIWSTVMRRRKNAHLLLGEDLGGAIDECGESAGELFQAEDDGIVEDGAGGTSSSSPEAFSAAARKSSS